jgi:hypothetical protein
MEPQTFFSTSSQIFLFCRFQMHYKMIAKSINLCGRKFDKIMNKLKEIQSRQRLTSKQGLQLESLPQLVLLR